MFFPDYTYYNQIDPFNSHFYSRQDFLRAKEMERRQRINQQQKDAERRRRMKQLEALEKQREKEEIRQQQRELTHQREQNHVAQQGENKYAFPPGTIIRGRDGRLYRVVADPSHIHQGIQANHDNQSASSNSFVSESDGTNSCTSDYSAEQECKNNNCNDMNVANTDSKCSLHATASEFIPKSSIEDNSNIPKKTITLVVEDVPLEEDEELRDLNSVWRNRMPSKGEWMEPVESYTI